PFRRTWREYLASRCHAVSRTICQLVCSSSDERSMKRHCSVLRMHTSSLNLGMQSVQRTLTRRLSEAQTCESINIAFAHKTLSFANCRSVCHYYAGFPRL